VSLDQGRVGEGVGVEQSAVHLLVPGGWEGQGFCAGAGLCGDNRARESENGGDRVPFVVLDGELVNSRDADQEQHYAYG